MTFSYTAGASDKDRVRMLIPDKDAENPILSDEEIESMLSIESGSLRRSVALAIETIATDEILILKLIRVSNLSTDGPAVGRALLARAEKLRQQALDDDLRSGAAFDWAEMVGTSFQAEQKLWNEAMRQG